QSARMRRYHKAHPLHTPKNSSEKSWQEKAPAESGLRRPPRCKLYEWRVDLLRSANTALYREAIAWDTYRTRGALVDHRAVYFLGTSSQPLLSAPRLAIDFRDSFCFGGLVDVPAQEISGKHSLDHSDWGC